MEHLIIRKGMQFGYETADTSPHEFARKVGRE